MSLKIHDYNDKKGHLLSIFIPIFAGLVFLVLAILNLRSSIWFDESYSAYLVRGDFAGIWDMTSVDVHPPLFYFALKIWSSIFGTTDFAMRFMSVFFGLVAIVFIFQAIKKWFGIRAAGFGTFFVAISPMFVRYGQEMRMYTMVLAIVAAATYFLSLALEKASEKAGRKYFVFYAILVALGMWTHYFSAFAWIAHFVMILVHFGGVRKFFKNKQAFLRVFFMYVFAVVLYIPWIPSFFKQVSTVQAGFWIPEVSLLTLSEFLTSALFFNKSQEVTSWGCVVGTIFMVLMGIAIFKIFSQVDTKIRKSFQAVFIVVGVPVVVMILLSMPPLKSMFVDRYVLYSIVALWALFGIVIAFLKGRAKIIMMALTILVAIFGVSFVEKREPRGFVKEIISEVFATAKEGEPIVANGVWTYYDGMFYSNEQHPIYLFEEGVEYKYGSLEPIRNYRVNLVEDSKEFLEKYKSVWYIFDRPGNGEVYETPEWAEKMRVVTEIETDHFVAFQFSL